MVAVDAVADAGVVAGVDADAAVGSAAVGAVAVASAVDVVVVAVATAAVVAAVAGGATAVVAVAAVATTDTNSKETEGLSLFWLPEYIGAYECVARKGGGLLKPFVDVSYSFFDFLLTSSCFVLRFATTTKGHRQTLATILVAVAAATPTKMARGRMIGPHSVTARRNRGRRASAIISTSSKWPAPKAAVSAASGTRAPCTSTSVRTVAASLQAAATASGVHPNSSRT